MKKTTIFLVFSLAASGFAFAQSPRAVLEKIREIKLLESTRDDVKRILADYESDDDDYRQDFSKDDWDIEVYYRKGYCTQIDDEDNEDSDRWNIPEKTVTHIEISPPGSIKTNDLGYDLSELKKEQRYANVEDFFVYYSKESGIYFEADEDQVQKILLFPARSNISRLCDNNEASKKFYASEDWFGDLKLENRNAIFEHGVSNVTDLTLSATEITVICNNSAQTNNWPNEVKEISVKTVGSDPENDVLTYNYTVTGGKIVGSGAEVIWDLTGAKPGSYTITAGVDDGCGICGQTQTEKVIVKECPNRAANTEKVFPANREFYREVKENERSTKTSRETNKTSRRVRRKSSLKIKKSHSRRAFSPSKGKLRNPGRKDRTKADGRLN